MTVDMKRFELKKSKIIKEKYFVYVGGSGGVERDSLEYMVLGFHLFLRTNPDFEFHIIGPMSEKSKNIKKIKDYVKDNKLSKNVLFKGVYESNKIPEVLHKAIGIVMTPQKDFKSGGFPTKLGEFLASGTPVITTDISEISNYLNYGNSFIIKPGKAEDIAKEMENIVRNPENAINIGEEGRKVAEKYFNAESYITELQRFLNLTD
jgi:glycosyltransferase involved in cell wall biosynthesis